MGRASIHPREVFLPKWLDSLGSLLKGNRDRSSEKKLSALAAEAEKASPGNRWAAFNRLGDAYHNAGDRPRALRYFGKAIDSLLEDDQPEPARAVAKKVARAAMPTGLSKAEVITVLRPLFSAVRAKAAALSSPPSRVGFRTIADAKSNAAI